MRKYLIALYIRLSLEDSKTESMSIPNQRLILREKAMSLHEWENAEVMEFVDNGHSGMNFERPAVQELLEMVQAGKVDCIIVKDLSRFGRNSIETGYFIERVFPLYHTRFISVSDHFDTADYKGDTGGIDVAFKYLISECYSRDMSMKTKSAKYAKMRRGEYQSAICPYGYQKSADGRMEPDKEAAEIVSQMFLWAADGNTVAEIVRRLYAQRVPTPAEYRAAKGKPIHDTSRSNGVWSSSAVIHKLNKEKKRISELDTIIKKLYESFAIGRITGERFDSLLAEYEAEQKTLTESVSEMETQMSAFAEDTDRAKQFLELAKKYTDFSELTTPMINEFVEKIIVHAPEKIDGDRVQEVDIHLRFIGQFELPAPELTEEEIKRQEQLKRHRIKSRERYQKIKAGEHAVGQPFMLTCKCCGQEFASKRTNTLFCGPNCRAKFYRQEAAESRSRACTCENCGKEFITARSDVKYCSDDCRYAAQIKRQGARKKALREAKNEKETKSA